MLSKKYQTPAQVKEAIGNQEQNEHPRHLVFQTAGMIFLQSNINKHKQNTNTQ
jgi:hypothetical protein|tara:strand:+ start:196 stop:354 length:159 start_codon:yes stop_codon:yes gene_type:complete